MLLLPAFLLLSATLAAAAADEKPCTTYDSDGTFYDLNPMASTTDYYFKSFGGHEFYINVCRSVRTDTWALENPDQVGGFLREDRGDFSIGQVNTAVQIRDGHPLLILTDGSKCPGGGDVRASTAIRFICDRSVFSAGKPQLIAELPPQDEQACAFFIEWRTHAACPAAEPGGAWGIFAVFIMIAIGAFMLCLILYIAYNRFVRNQRGFSQLPNMPLSSSTGTVLDYFYDLRDRMGFTSDRWASDRSWQGFSGGSGFERLATSREEAQGMLGRNSQEEDGADETPTPHAEMDAHGVIRL